MQGFNDDLWSIIVTMFQEYGLFWRFIVAVFLSLICIAIISRVLLIKTIPLPQLSGTKKTVGFSVGLVAVIAIFGLFVRFGGSFTYGSGINWENAAVTSDNFLNECILDDAQALYRARAMAKRMAAGEISGVDANRILESAQVVAGNGSLTEENLAPYLERKATGQRIPTPKHIFIILGETYMQWPLLGKYDELLLADGLKSLIAEDKCYYSRNFLPNGDFTSSAINGLVTGLPDVNIRVNYQARTYEKLYITSMAAPLKELGYRVDFWYGGMPSWDSIGKMSLAQGFDNFYGSPDYGAPKQTTWGTKDENLFNALLKHLDEEPPTVHLIMTTSNHPPYNLDLASYGFDVDSMTEMLKKYPNVDDPHQLAIELGHFWCMWNVKFWIKDKVVGTRAYHENQMGERKKNYFPRVGYNSDHGVYIRDDFEIPLLPHLNLNIGAYVETKKGIRSNVELEYGNRGFNALLKYGFYDDSDARWIQKEPSLDVEYTNKISGSPLTYKLEGEYGHWRQNSIASTHQEYAFTLYHDPIAIGKYVLFLDVGYRITKDNPQKRDSGSNRVNGMSYNITLGREFDRRFAAYLSYSYNKNNSSNTLFEFNNDNFSRKVQGGFSYYITPKDRVVIGVKWDADNHRLDDIDYYWYHDLHCSQAVVRWRGKRKKLEVHWEFIPF